MSWRQPLLRRESAIDLEPQLLRDFENSHLVDLLLSAPELGDLQFFDEPVAGLGCTSEYILIEAQQRSTGRVVTCKVSRQVMRVQRDLYCTNRLVKNDTHRLLVKPLGTCKLREYGLVVLILDAELHNRLRQQEILAAMTIKEFLDFAVRACYCLEFIHSQGIVHGEIRPDALLWSKPDQVRLFPFGSGVHSWENALSSESWKKLSQERGLDRRLAFISPEQTGRMGKEPGHRTDLYSLGLVFFFVLTRRLPFEGSPMQVLQGALSKRCPDIALFRKDVPPRLMRIIAKLTEKRVEDRYHGASGVRHDLEQLIADPACDALIGRHDVSSLFVLPSGIVGREVEQELILRQLTRFFKAHAAAESARRGIIESTRDDPHAFDDNQSQCSSRSSVANSFSRSGSLSTAGSTLRLEAEASGKRRCQCLALSGPGGIGKSSLVALAAMEARKFGYFASSKFDRSQSTPYSAILRCVSSILQQVLAENEARITELQQGIRLLTANGGYARLGPLMDLLPELRSLVQGAQDPGSPSMAAAQMPSSAGSVTSHGSLQTVSEFTPASQYVSDVQHVRSGGTKLRFVTMFLDVLRILSSIKPVTLALDDVHQADDASLELIQTMVNAKLSVMLIVSFRNNEGLEETPLGALLAQSHPAIAVMQVMPLSTQAMQKFISTALARPAEYVEPLAKAVLQRCGGNAFFMREILLRLHRDQVISFDWKSSRWQIDLEKLHAALSQTSLEDDSLISARLRSMSKASQVLCYMASFFGRTFSFDMVCSLMLKDISWTEELSEVSDSDAADYAVAGLQVALGEGIINGLNEDSYTFVHDRYLSACQLLAGIGGNVAQIHLYVAEVLHAARQDIFFIADNVIQALPLVKTLSSGEIMFWRRQIFMAGTKAGESGAHEVAIRYYRACTQLLPADHWAGEAYASTLQILVRFAECLWWDNKLDESQRILDDIFANARKPVDRATSHILLCRIQQTLGQHEQARVQMTQCIADLGFPVDFEPTYEKLDAWFADLKSKHGQKDLQTILDTPFIQDERIAAIAAVTAEATTAGYWSSPLWFTALSLFMTHIQIEYGNYPSGGMGFVYLGISAVSRKLMIDYGVECGRIGRQLLDRDAGPGTMARGLMCYYAFLHHFAGSLEECLTGQQTALQHAISAGDRIYASFCLSHIASLVYWGGNRLEVAKRVCQEGLSDLETWNSETDATTLILSIRQCVSALQGLTQINNPDAIFSDSTFDHQLHVDKVSQTSAVPQVPLNWYTSYYLVPLFHYGFFDKAIEVGVSFESTIDFHPCHRHTRQGLFWLGLSIAAKMRGTKSRDSMDKLRSIHGDIHAWLGPYKHNYFCWAKLLEAEICSLNQQFQQAAVAYEEALKSARDNGMQHEEALSHELAAIFYLENGLHTIATSLLREAVLIYANWGASGIVNHLQQRHASLLSRRITETVDVAVQTELQEEEPLWYQGQAERQNSMMDLDLGPKDDEKDLLTLDVIDLTSIIKSSQIISSEVNVETLFVRLLGTILETTAGNSAAIVVKEEGAFAIAAVGSMDHYETFKPPKPLADDEVRVSARIINYVIHTKEVVLLTSTTEDERFSSGPWFREHGERSVLALPIEHKAALVGVLYLQGASFAFNARHVQVFRMLSQQIGISITNALLFKSVQKATLANVAMIEKQKQSLVLARESENKYMAVLETMPCIIWTAGPDGLVDYFNGFWFRYGGPSAPSWKDNAWTQSIHPEDMPMLQATMQRAMQTGFYEEHELRIKDLHGNYKFHTARATPLRMGGKITKWIGGLIDIDDQKKARESALKAMHLKSNWMANMSHELRTPFAGFYGMLGLLSDTPLDEEQRDIVMTAQQSTTSLLQIIDDLLNFSKLEAGKVSLEPDLVFTVEELVADCVELIQPLAAKKNLEIAIDCRNVPVRLGGDSNKLRQVITNILGNANKFCEAGQIVVKVSTENVPVADDGNCFVRFDISDTGIGMSAEAMKALFRPFSQVDESITRKFGGTGLGLSICLQIVRLMDGEIGVESTVGIGSNFFFWIKLRKLDASVVDAHVDEAARNAQLIKKDLVGVRMLMCTGFKYTQRSLTSCVPDNADLSVCTSSKEAMQLLEARASSMPMQILLWDLSHDECLGDMTAILDNPALSMLQVIWLHVPKATSHDARQPQQPRRQDSFEAPQAILHKYGDRLTRLAKPLRTHRLALAFSKALANLKGGQRQDKRLMKPSAPPAPQRGTYTGVFTTAELATLRTRHVLIAEDNPIAQKLLFKQLSKYGLLVDVANNGLEAIAHFESHEPGYYDLFFSDHHMPLCSGIDCAKAIRLKEKTTAAKVSLPIVALTADIVPENRDACLAAGMERYLSKPLQLASLISTIRQYILR